MALTTYVHGLFGIGAGWYELPASQRRIPAMEGIRGLAVLLVFCVHYHDQFSIYLAGATWQLGLAHFFGTIGHCGVDLFFILSGYLIYGAAIKPDLKLVEFWRRRVERIYPTFLVVFLIYLVLSYVFPERSRVPGGLWPNTLFFAGNLLLLAGLAPVAPLNTVTWSLSFEAFYYVSLPILVLATQMYSWSRFARVAFVLVLSLLYVTLFLSGPLFRPGYWTHARMLMFVAGILLYERVRAVPSSTASSGRVLTVAILFLASFPAFFYLHELSYRPDFDEDLALLTLGKVLLTAIAYYLFCLECFRSKSGLGRPFEWFAVRWLGNMSYSYYLIHGLVIHFCYMVIQNLLPAGTYGATVYWSVIPLVLACTLIVSTILFLAVERPLSLRT